MKKSGLARHYDVLTPEERFRLLLQAFARDDRAEVDRLDRTCPSKTYTMSDGTTRLKFNGFQAATVQGNGKTLHFNISGPGTIFINGDMVALVGTGHGLYIGPPGTTQPGVRLYTGKVEYAVEPSGNAIVTSYTGRVTDICALLS